jgi:hypothetical protein
VIARAGPPARALVVFIWLLPRRVPENGGPQKVGRSRDRKLRLHKSKELKAIDIHLAQFVERLFDHTGREIP